MLEFLVDAEYFQVVLSDARHVKGCLAWDEESLQKGIAYNEHTVFITTYGSDESYSAKIHMTILDDTDNFTRKQKAEYEWKAKIRFRGKSKDIFILRQGSLSGHKHIELLRDGFTMDVYAERATYPLKILLRMLNTRVVALT